MSRKLREKEMLPSVPKGLTSKHRKVKAGIVFYINLIPYSGKYSINICNMNTHTHGESE